MTAARGEVAGPVNCTARYHGTYSAANNHGCTCPEAADLKYRRDKRYKYVAGLGITLKVPAIGTVRRIQALQCLGYSVVELKAHLGKSTASRRNLYPNDRTGSGMVNAATAEQWRVLFDKLCMTPSTGPRANHIRAMAFNRGFAPPLAWDDIDDPGEQPSNDFLRLKRRRERQAKERARYHQRRAAGTERGSKVA